jgi:hypothetical protein
VSPQRKKCLIEQVSLNRTGPRSCSCCQKGTVGGYPPHYNQWFEPAGDQNWQRTDNWTLDKEDVSQLPPTQLVMEPKKTDNMHNRVKRSQVEMYNQIMD